jgi:putative Ca2+/H+ antiporter (TMEM165/GDT1 family)
MRPAQEVICFMEALFVSALVVAIAEIGDKTQLLAIILATRFKKPVPIILGILVATLANHALAATAGYWVSDLLSGKAFQWAIALSFIAMAAWALIPDKADDEDGANAGRYGVFLTTTIAFFLVEMGDKTQIATVALGAKFHSIVWVAAGTTLGMMLANIPAVYLGEAATKIIPLNYVRIGAAVIFLGLGLWGIAQAAGLFR